MANVTAKLAAARRAADRANVALERFEAALPPCDGDTMPLDVAARYSAVLAATHVAERRLYVLADAVARYNARRASRHN